MTPRLLLLLAATLSTPVAIAVEPVTVNGASFESPLVTTGSSSATVTGWLTQGDVSVYRPASGDPPATDGGQYLLGNSTNFGIQQVLSIPFEADTRYILEVDLWPLNPDSSWAQVRLADLTAGRFLSERNFRPPGWTPPPEQFPFPAGRWTTVRVPLHTADFPGVGGHTMSIALNGGSIAIDNVRLTRITTEYPPAANYYISSSDGDDNNSGLSADSPWHSLAKVSRQRFAPGSSILLKRGDIWNEELNLRGSGTAEAKILLGTYGEGPRPLIEREDRDWDRCIVINNGSYWQVRGLAGRNAALGLFLRYFETTGHRDMLVEDCHFSDMDSWYVDALDRNLEWSGPAGVWIGGLVKTGGPEEFATVLDGITIRNCATVNCTAGFGSSWYFPALHRSRLTNLLIEDCFSTRVSIGGLSFHGVTNGVIRRYRTFDPCGRDEPFVWGSTGGIISSCANILLEDCEFSETDRMWPDQTQGDGCGFDIDGNNDGVTMRRCHFHSNEGPGLLTLGTFSANSNVLIEDCTFWNNALDASDNTYAPGGNAYEIKITENTVTNGIVRNCGFHRNDLATWWNYPPVPPTVIFENPRFDYWDEATLPASDPEWTWDSETSEGWTPNAQWGSPQFSGGAMTGISGGVDPFVESPPLWINPHRTSPWLRLRMKTTDSQTLIFFTTETDPFWSIEKSIAIPTTPDGEWHDYRIDLRQAVSAGSVVTGLRIDPSQLPGEPIALDYVTFTPDPSQQRLSIQPEIEGVHRLIFQGDPGLAWRLWISSDLDQWQPGQTLTADTAGLVEFRDASAGGQPQRFYKVGRPVR